MPRGTHCSVLLPYLSYNTINIIKLSSLPCPFPSMRMWSELKLREYRHSWMSFDPRIAVQRTHRLVYTPCKLAGLTDQLLIQLILWGVHLQPHSPTASPMAIITTGDMKNANAPPYSVGLPYTGSVGQNLVVVVSQPHPDFIMCCFSIPAP